MVEKKVWNVLVENSFVYLSVCVFLLFAAQNINDEKRKDLRQSIKLQFSSDFLIGAIHSHGARIVLFFFFFFFLFCCLLVWSLSHLGIPMHMNGNEKNLTCTFTIVGVYSSHSYTFPYDKQKVKKIKSFFFFSSNALTNFTKKKTLESARAMSICVK